MRRAIGLATLAAVIFTCQANAWNEKGHYVVCRLAWLQMNDQQRAAVTEILKKHPHYDEYLAKKKPDGFTTDEWVFMRAGAWAEAIHANEGAIQTLAWSPLKAEFEKRGFSCKFVRSPKTESKTPNQDRGGILVKALKDVEGDIVLVGVSNEGLFMPLVAAERPIRRIVMINAVVPTPGKSFREAFDFKDVFASKFAIRLAQSAPGMSEVCPLKQLPKVEYVYIYGETDDAIRPEWERLAARKYLHVEPVVVKGAGHANIVWMYSKAVVDAATKGF
jgi:hypothetical protein